MNAYEELQEYLVDGEQVETIIFGNWGLNGYNEPSSKPVPQDKKGIKLTLDEAKPFMDGWKFTGGYGAPKCYAVHIWTNVRVIWVTQYDGSTMLTSVTRNPPTTENIHSFPYMPGG